MLDLWFYLFNESILLRSLSIIAVIYDDMHEHNGIRSSWIPSDINWHCDLNKYVFNIDCIKIVSRIINGLRNRLNRRWNSVNTDHILQLTTLKKPLFPMFVFDASVCVLEFVLDFYCLPLSWFWLFTIGSISN